MSVNIQQADKTLKKVADTTVVNKSTVTAALGYTPVTPEQLSTAKTELTNSINTTKTNLTNSINEVGSNLSTTADNLQQQIDALEGSAFDGDYNKLKNAPILNDKDGTAIFTDEAGNIVTRMDNNGLETANLNLHGDIELADEKLEIIDETGNIVLRIDDNGVETKTTNELKTQVTNINTELPTKAPIYSPTFTGAPKAPSPIDNSSQRIATADYVDNAVAGLQENISDIFDFNDDGTLTLADTEGRKIAEFDSAGLRVTNVTIGEENAPIDIAVKFSNIDTLFNSKIDKVSTAVENNLASFTSGGQVKDTGKIIVDKITNSTNVPTDAAVKTYVDNEIIAHNTSVNESIATTYATKTELANRVTELNSATGAVATDLEAHITETDGRGKLHITTAEREAWDAAKDYNNLTNKPIEQDGNDKEFIITYNDENHIMAKIDETGLRVLDVEIGPEGSSTTLSTKFKNIDTELDNRYTKIEADEKIAEAIAGAEHLKREIVNALPVSNINAHIIYMVKATSDEQSDRDLYDEYMYINNTWERLGSWQTDLNGYVKNDTLNEYKQEVLANFETSNKNINDHIVNENNPHKVTAEQVGLGNVTNESKTTMFTNPNFTGGASIDGEKISTEEYVDNAISQIKIPELNYPVISVNGKTGEVTLDANDVNAYTKGETDGLLNNKANTADVYTKNDIYTKKETDNLLSPKADADKVYTKTETNDLLKDKANTTDIYTKEETNGLLNNKAPLASPSLTGTPTAPTAAADTNTTQIATTAFVANAIKNTSDKANSKFEALNFYKTVIVGSTSIEAEGNDNTLTFVAGSNVTLTPDATNKKVTISSVDTDTGATSIVTSGEGNAVTDASYDSANRKITLTKGEKFATTSDVNTHINNEGIHVTEADKTKWDAKSDFSGKYADLIDKPELSVYATTEYVDTENDKLNTLLDSKLNIQQGTEYVNKVLVINANGNVVPGNPTIEGAVEEATKFATPRNISLKGAITGSGMFDGSEDLEIATTVNHNHDDMYYTEDEINTKLAEKADKTTVEELTKTVNTKASTESVTNLSNIVAGKATQDDLNALDAKVTTHIGNYTHITADERTKWNAKSNFSGSYNDLTDKPIIPTIPTIPNNFKTIKVGETNINADNTEDTLTLAAGTNITLTPDVDTDKITISSVDTGATSIITSGEGNAVTGGSYDAATRKITLTKDTTFATKQEHDNHVTAYNTFKEDFDSKFNLKFGEGSLEIIDNQTERNILARFDNEGLTTTNININNINAKENIALEPESEIRFLDRTSGYYTGIYVSGNQIEPYYSDGESNDPVHLINLAAPEDDSAATNKEYVDTVVNAKMDKENPVGTGSFSLNRAENSTIGLYSFAEGFDTTASGGASHAEGRMTTAINIGSHAEGWSTEARNTASHAEGLYTYASGGASHVEGSGSHAVGDYSHAEGLYTIAQSANSHAQGKYNIADNNSTYAHIVGNGTAENARSNAHTLDWEGNSWYAGGLYVGGEEQDDANIKILPEENNTFTISDNNKNIIAQFDKDGLTATNFIIRQNTADGVIIYDLNEIIKNLNNNASNSNIIVSETSPTSPTEGMVWIDTSTENIISAEGASF